MSIFFKKKDGAMEGVCTCTVRVCEVRFWASCGLLYLVWDMMETMDQINRLIYYQIADAVCMAAYHAYVRRSRVTSSRALRALDLLAYFSLVRMTSTLAGILL